MKTCTVCKTEKPFSDFHKFKNSEDGHQPRCKECKNAYTRNKYKADAAAPKVTPSHSTCTKCLSLMPVEKFRVKTNGIPYSYCRQCSKMYTNEVRKQPAIVVEEKTCTVCEKTKPFEEFKWERNRYSFSWCRECRNDNKREWYRNTPGALEQTKKYTRKRKDKNEHYVFQYLLANPCQCGEKNPVYLEFDHKDPKNKRDAVARMVDKVGLRTLCAELKKCDVLCRKCHRRRTAKQLSWRKGLVKDFDYGAVIKTLGLPTVS